jgi:hypothetical protein
MTTVARYQRGVWTYIRNEATDGAPPTPKEGETWYDPAVCVARQFNGTGWEYFHFSQDSSTWGIGGYAMASGYTNKIRFSDDTPVKLTSSVANGYLGAGVGSRIAGYSLGYYSGATNTGITKLAFSDEVASALASSHPRSVIVGAAFSSSTNGYCAGGVTTPVVTIATSGIDKLNFSTEAASTITTTLTYTRYGSGIGCESASDGYAGCGRNTGADSTDSEMSSIDKLIFSSDTTGVLTSLLNQSRTNTLALSSTARGYWGGGNFIYSPPRRQSRIDALNFSAQTTYVLTSTLVTAMYAGNGINSLVKGYFDEGYDASGNNITYSVVMPFATEAVSSTSATHMTHAAQGATFENLN